MTDTYLVEYVFRPSVVLYFNRDELGQVVKLRRYMAEASVLVNGLTSILEKFLMATGLHARLARSMDALAGDLNPKLDVNFVRWFQH